MAVIGTPAVFVSYAHDSEAHKDDVRDLARLLMSMGIEVELDQWVPDRQDWSAWATAKIRDAAFVIVVASPDYKAAGDGGGPPEKNRGSRFEAAFLRELLQRDRAHWTRKFLPVVLPGHTIDDIPDFLLPYNSDHFIVDALTADGVEDIVRKLTGQHHRTRPPLGTIPVLPPKPERDTGNGTGHHDRPRRLADFAADVEPHCLAVQAAVAAAKSRLSAVDMSTDTGRQSTVELLRQWHVSLADGWQALHRVALPTVDDDLRRAREWQETYLLLQNSLSDSAARLQNTLDSPRGLSFLIIPFQAQQMGESLRLSRHLTHLSRLLGIANPLGT